MPLQHAAAGEQGEVNIQEADRITLPPLGGVQAGGKNHGGGPVSRLCFLQIISFCLLSAEFSDACTVRPSQREVQNTPQSPHHFPPLHQSSSVTPYCFILASLHDCLVSEVLCR